MADEAVGGKLIYSVDYQVPEKEKKKMDFLMKQQPKLDKLYQSFSKSGAGAVATGAGLIGAAIMMVTAGGGFRSVLGALWDLMGLISDLVFVALWPVIKPLLTTFVKAIQSGKMQWLIDALVFFGTIIISFIVVGYFLFKMFMNGVKMLGEFFGWLWDGVVWFVGGVADFIGGIWDFLTGIPEMIGGLINGFVEGATAFFGGIGEALGGVFDTIVGLLQPVIDAFNGFINLLQQIVDAFTGFLGGIGEGAGDVVGGIGQAAGDAWSAITFWDPND